MANQVWERPTNPPGPLFAGEKERNLVKQIQDEAVERIVGSYIFYYPISRNETNFHPIYGEAIIKNFYPPIRINTLVKWNGYKTETTQFGVDRRPLMEVNFSSRRLREDIELEVRVGDFIKYGDNYFEIYELNEPERLFGDIEYNNSIIAKAIKARSGVFNGSDTDGITNNG